MTRLCERCGTPLPAGAHFNRTTCSRSCKEALYRERRRPQARPSLPPSTGPDLDRLAARLRQIDGDIMAEWRERKS